jgi:PTS system N-acetylglucosamine-specific IIC component
MRAASRAGAIAGGRPALPRGEPSPAVGIKPVSATATEQDAATFLAAMGGRNNLAAVEGFAGRLLMRVADPKAIDERVLGTLGVRGIAHPAPGSVQVLVSGPVEAWAEPLKRIIGSNV